ncbi:MAG TPA: thioredoxin domain-containing protein [Terriglobales bacterium]|nr:thioredoxin domain-containing protein [Terriglobales bacterium]
MRNRGVFRMVAALALLALPALAQDPRSEVLRPPKGAKVALVVFEDLQCPDCGRAAPLLSQAARTYKIPQVRYDFPLKMHPWARQAAIFAKYFDTKSKALGDEFRDYIFANQPVITPDNLRSYAEKFAGEHKLALPFAVDPMGVLEKKVDQDINVGLSVGVQHTPTIYVVSDARAGTPFVEVVDRSQLFQMIDEMKRQAGAR